MMKLDCVAVLSLCQVGKMCVKVYLAMGHSLQSSRYTVALRHWLNEMETTYLKEKEISGPAKIHYHLTSRSPI